MPTDKISLNKGIHRTPTYGPEGQLSHCINVIPRGGELVNILPPGITAQTVVITDGSVVTAVHHVSPEDVNHYFFVYPTTGKLSWRVEGNSTANILRSSGSAIKQVRAIGNVIAVLTATGIIYYLWKNGQYISLGDADFALDIQFGISATQRTRADKNTKAVRFEEGQTATGGDSELVYESGPSGSSIKSKLVSYEPVGGFTVGDEYNIQSSRPSSSSSNVLLHVQLVCRSIGGTGDSTHDIVVPGGAGLASVVIPALPEGLQGAQWYRVNVSWQYNGSGQLYSFNYVKIYKINPNATPVLGTSFNLRSGADKIVGMANEFVASATAENKFVMPFFARYAIKLRTGHYINVSAPCLLEPNNYYAPEVWMHIESKDNADIYTSLLVRGFVADLQYRIHRDGALDWMRDFRDIIESVVIAVTPPVFLYDQSVSEETLEANALLIKPGDDIGTMYTNAQQDSGVWGSELNKSYAITGEILPSPPADSFLMLLPTGAGTSEDKDTYLRNQKTKALSTWYVVAEIPLSALSDSASWVTIPMQKGTLNALYGLGDGELNTLNDTAVSNYRLTTADKLFEYNNRLFFLGGTEQLRLNWNPVRMSGWVAHGSSDWIDSSATHQVNVECADQSTITYYLPQNGRHLGSLRFFGVPDATARSITYNYSGSYGSRKVLKPQGTQEMAVAFHNSATMQAHVKEGNAVSTYRPNRLYMSYINQPLVLDRTATITFTGSVRALSVVTEALSQGQRGQFPLYVFTSDGVWTLSVNSAGVLTASSPVSRDVITPGTEPLQTDNAIFFITAHGLMRLRGDKTELVSTPVHGADMPSRLFAPDASYMADYAGMLTASDDIDFLQGLQSARMLYDYVQQLIHIYFDDKMHYVMSLETGEWAEQRVLCYSGAAYSIFENPQAIVPAYPLSIMQQHTVGLTYLCFYTDEMRGKFEYDKVTPQAPISFGRYSVIVTRPISMGEPAAMKALMDLRVIGQDGTTIDTWQGQSLQSNTFRRVAVWGSKDGYKWHPVRSLKRGSYKYFRFAVYCMQADTDAIQGLILDYDIRRNHRLR